MHVYRNNYMENWLNWILYPFIQLDLFLEDDQFLDDLNYRLRSSKLSRMLNEVVEPGLDSLFPQDLKRITSVLSWLVFSVIENRDRLSQVHFVSHSCCTL